MSISESQKRRFRDLAVDLEAIDRPAYEAAGRDPLAPIIGLGDPANRIGIFGRDPGREEVRHGMPFIGSGGQKVRATLYEYLHGTRMPGFEASVEVGRQFFWANTVPYKPEGNKAWPMRVKRPFQPLMAELLLTRWRGRDLITLGREAFLWFGINQPKDVRDALAAFWEREDRFDAIHETPLTDAGGRSRRLRLHPLPHPSPLNATWYKHFPALLRARLSALEARPGNLRLTGS